MERGTIQIGEYSAKVVCQFVVRSKFKFGLERLTRDLQSRLHEAKLPHEVKIRWVSQQQGGLHRHVYRVMFPMRLGNPTTESMINSIVKHLDAIEQDVEKVIKLTSLLELVE